LIALSIQHRAQGCQGRRVVCAVHFTLDNLSTVLRLKGKQTQLFQWARTRFVFSLAALLFLIIDVFYIRMAFVFNGVGRDGS